VNEEPIETSFLASLDESLSIQDAAEAAGLTVAELLGRLDVEAI
jgi:hypothetical protein